jgi:hypothetical protein
MDIQILLFLTFLVNKGYIASFHVTKDKIHVTYHRK